MQGSPPPPVRLAILACALIALLDASGCAPDWGGGVCAQAVTPRNTVEVYDPAHARWAFGPPMPLESHGTRCTDIAGTIYVSGFGHGGTFLLRFDPAQRTWEQLPDAPVPVQAEHDVVSLGADLYLLGSGTLVQIFDTLSETWSMGPDMLNPHYRPAAVELAGVIYAIGGHNDKLEALDPVLGAWQDLAPVPQEVTGHAAETDGARIFVVSWDVWIYDPTLDAWSNGPSPPGVGYVRDSGVIGDEIFVLGYRQEMYALDATTLTWSARPPRQRFRIWSGVTESGGYLYAIGGGSPTPCHE